MDHTITRITIHSNRFTLHFGTEKIILPLHIEYTGKYGKDDSISDEELNSLRILSRSHICIDSALSYISRSLRTEKQLSEYLKKKEFSKEEIEGAIDTLYERNLLNDRLFCAEFVLGLARRKVVGRKYAEHKLLQKGVPASIIKEVLDEKSELFENSDDLYDLACLKFDKLGGKKDKFGKIGIFLQRRGFTSSQIMSVLNKMKNNGYNFKD